MVHQVSPITQTFPAIIVKKMQGKPLILWVLDLWPDAFISGSGINNRFIISLLDKYVDFSYKNSNKILISSKGFKESILEKTGDEKKYSIFLIGRKGLFYKRKRTLSLNFQVVLK
ncbi:hypothetical protein [Chryseobacterium sp. POE27]|uniref:hypothetical protein n=1 Tax=Chryseobacterium sp. POE27 TaxID=3138177 RepID=UPI00321AC050